LTAKEKTDRFEKIRVKKFVIWLFFNFFNLIWVTATSDRPKPEICFFWGGGGESS